MTKNIIICCDGTGNEVEENISNVLKLYRVLDKGQQSGQVVFYDPGIGTLGNKKPWSPISDPARHAFYAMTGADLDGKVLTTYKFLIDTYEEGDEIYLFGFSRGAYTVKVLAGLLHLVGLLKPEQKHLSHYAFGAFRHSSKKNDYRLGERFHRVVGTRAVPVKFLGVWDTVCSVFVPVLYGIEMQKLLYTDTNPGVKIFRQALAIDERRRLFRVDPWKDKQQYKPNPYKIALDEPQDAQQVWFAGTHSDVGGGFAETESGLAKIALVWMIEAAKAAGLRINTAMYNHLVLGKERKGSQHTYVPPDPAAQIHKMAHMYWPFECLPRRIKFREWKDRKECLGFYIPMAEPRRIPEHSNIHRSVIDRMQSVSDYKPVNLPKEYSLIE